MNKWANELNRPFSKQVQAANKYMENVHCLSYQRNGNQNYIGISSHPTQNGYHQEKKTNNNKQKQMLVRMPGKKDPCKLLMGM
jgi:hypothetical protein